MNRHKPYLSRMHCIVTYMIKSHDCFTSFQSPCAYYDSTTMMSPYDLRLSFSADDALDLQRDSNMSTRIQYVPSPTILSHGDDAIRITSSPPRLLPHEILRLQPLAVAVGFDQLEDSDGRTVVIMPSQNDMNSQRNYFTESSTSRSVGTFGVRQSSSRGGKGNFRSTATATGSI